MELTKPDGFGDLKISRMTISTSGFMLDFEGQVEGYGSVFCSHELTFVGGDESRGTLTGEARTFLHDGTIISTPHSGTFQREQSKIYSYFTDATDHGAVNFVAWDINLLSKEVTVRYWEVSNTSPTEN